MAEDFREEYKISSTSGSNKKGGRKTEFYSLHIRPFLRNRNNKAIEKANLQRNILGFINENLDNINISDDSKSFVRNLWDNQKNLRDKDFCDIILIEEINNFFSEFLNNNNPAHIPLRTISISTCEEHCNKDCENARNKLFDYLSEIAGSRMLQTFDHK